MRNEDIPNAVGIPEKNAIRRTILWLTTLGISAELPEFLLVLFDLVDVDVEGGRLVLFFLLV